MKQKNPTYTIILHQPRKRLGLSLMEYCVADCIYHLSNNPRSKVLGWCYSSKENIAKFLGTSSVTIFNNIDKLIEKGLVEKDNETKYLQTTKKWYENVIVSDYKETLEPIKKLNKGIKKLYTEPLRNFIPDHKETLYNSNKDNNINKDISNKDNKLYLSEDLRLAKLLFSLIRQNSPTHKQPNIDNWANDVRKIRELDGRTEEQIEIIMRWAQQDDFWQSNILSPAKLRKQFDALVIKARSEIKAKQQKKGMKIL